MRDEMFSAERGRGHTSTAQAIHVSGATELQKSLLVTGFPYDAWDSDRDNFDNFVRFSKLTQGVRRLGSAALDAAWVAAGRFDGFWEISLKAWDIAAGGLIAEEAGARVTNVQERAGLYFPPAVGGGGRARASTARSWSTWASGYGRAIRPGSKLPATARKRDSR